MKVTKGKKTSVLHRHLFLIRKRWSMCSRFEQRGPDVKQKLPHKLHYYRAEDFDPCQGLGDEILGNIFAVHLAAKWVT